VKAAGSSEAQGKSSRSELRLDIKCQEQKLEARPKKLQHALTNGGAV
jgi:hypothetical protein